VRTERKKFYEQLEHLQALYRHQFLQNLLKKIEMRNFGLRNYCLSFVLLRLQQLQQCRHRDYLHLGVWLQLNLQQPFCYFAY
jgi:hypothetical protein